MSDLTTYCDNGLTDKNTIHSYLEVYEELFRTKRDTAEHVLEIGIGPYPNNGGSILMWAGYFKKADIHAVDIISLSEVNPALHGHPRVYVYPYSDAYHRTFFETAFGSKPIRFDIIVDDGPHTIVSMITFLRLYSKVLKEDGVMVIEDVQDIEWCDTLRAATPDHLKPFIRVVDRRGVKGRYDDLLFVIDCSRRIA